MNYESESNAGVADEVASPSDEAPAQPPEILVVVPTRNSGATLERCLASIREQSVPCTLVVVDNFSTDNTVEIARRWADVTVSAGPERSRQRNIGASSAPSTYVGFIDSDMEFTPGVLREVLDAFAAGAATVTVPELTVGTGYWANVSTFERSFYQADSDIEAPRFFVTSDFLAIGGFDEEMTGAEDWDLGIRTESFGPRTRITGTILHDEGRVRIVELAKKKAYYAPGVLLFIKKHGAGATLKRANRQWLLSPRMVTTPYGVGLLMMKGLQVVTMSWAILKARRTPGQ